MFLCLNTEPHFEFCSSGAPTFLFLFSFFFFFFFFECLVLGIFGLRAEVEKD